MTRTTSTLLHAISHREIILVGGLPASGKTTLSQDYVDKGYFRINRDNVGGDLRKQVRLVEKALDENIDKILIDNTYITIESREEIIQLAKRKNAVIRCLWMDTSLNDALFNACFRMVSIAGKLLSHEEIKALKHPNIFPIFVLFSANKKLTGKDPSLKYKGKQYPTLLEGFDSVEYIKFKRSYSSEYAHKALILDYDDTLRRSSGPQRWPEKPEHVEVLPKRSEILSEYKQKGYLLLGASNQATIARGLPEADCIACFEKTNELLGHDVEIQYCPHKVPPLTCWCRKPQPGMGAYWIWKHKLNPSECIMVGDAKTDETFADKCGFDFVYSDAFFK